MPRKKRKYEEYMTLGTAPDGKRIRKFICADTKPEFDRLKFEAKKEYELVRNPSAVTFGAYAKQWIKIYKSNTSLQTQSMYHYALAKCDAIDNKPLREVTASDLQSIINKHINHPRSCQQLKLTLKQIYNAAIRDGILPPFNIAKDIEIPEYKCKERRFITDAEMEKINKCKFQPLDDLYVAILKNTGMRPSEVLALQWTDIDAQALTITVQRAFEFDHNIAKVKDTKTHTKRLVPIPKKLADRLESEKKLGLFVITRDGAPFTKAMFNQLSYRILSEVNRALGGTDQLSILNGLSLYSFRHTYATWLYYNAVVPGMISTKKAAAIMGHSEEIYLSRYTHINEEHEDLEKLRALLNDSKKNIGLPVVSHTA